MNENDDGRTGSWSDGEVALIEDIAVAMVITVTPEGALRSRRMLTQELREEGERWFFTLDDAEMAGDLSEAHAVNVAYAQPDRDRYVSVSGQATLVKDRKKIGEFWDDSLTRYFRNGLDNPHLTLMCVRIESVEFWDTANRRMLPLRRGKGSRDDQSPPNVDKTRDDNDVSDSYTKVAIRAVPASG